MTKAFVFAFVLVYVVVVFEEVSRELMLLFYCVRCCHLLPSSTSNPFRKTETTTLAIVDDAMELDLQV